MTENKCNNNFNKNFNSNFNNNLLNFYNNFNNNFNNNLIKIIYKSFCYKTFFYNFSTKDIKLFSLVIARSPILYLFFKLF